MKRDKKRAQGPKAAEAEAPGDDHVLVSRRQVMDALDYLDVLRSMKATEEKISGYVAEAMNREQKIERARSGDRELGLDLLSNLVEFAKFGQAPAQLVEFYETAIASIQSLPRGSKARDVLLHLGLATPSRRPDRPSRERDASYFLAGVYCNVYRDELAKERAAGQHEPERQKARAERAAQAAVQRTADQFNLGPAPKLTPAKAREQARYGEKIWTKKNPR